MNSALVTGATGFIGSHLVDELIKRNFNVFATARYSSDLSHLEDKDVEIIFVDLLDTNTYSEKMVDVDYIFHLAGVTKALKADKYFKVNAEATAALLSFCVKQDSPVNKFVYLSSQAASCPSEDEPVDENDEPEPVSTYGESKLQGEKFAKSFREMLPVTIIRPPTVFGPRDTDVYFYFKSINWHLQPYLGDPEKKFSLIYVKDLARALITAATCQNTDNKLYFIDNKSPCSWKQFSDLIAESLQKNTVEIALPEMTLHPLAYLMKAGSILIRKPALLNPDKLKELTQEWVCCSEKFYSDTNFTLDYSLPTSIQETIDWYQNNGWL